jgi:hypothetical protein
MILKYFYFLSFYNVGAMMKIIRKHRATTSKLSTVVSPYLQLMCSKTPSGYLKPYVVLNPILIMLFDCKVL